MALRTAIVYSAAALFVAFGITACAGSDKGGNAGSGGIAAGGSGGTGGTQASGGSGGTGGSGGHGGSGGSGGSGQVDPCAPPQETSSCGNVDSIVRAHVTLPADAPGPISGKLKLNLNHVRLGQGDTGGYGHVPLGTLAPFKNVSLQPGQSADFELDMCLGGEMWSEEACEFNFFAWIDLNDNEMVDPGEPAGRQRIEVSCHDKGSQCYSLPLSCTSGVSCVSFTADQVCKCAANSCHSEIPICTP